MITVLVGQEVERPDQQPREFRHRAKPELSVSTCGRPDHLWRIRSQGRRCTSCVGSTRRVLGALPTLWFLAVCAVVHLATQFAGKFGGIPCILNDTEGIGTSAFSLDAVGLGDGPMLGRHTSWWLYSSSASSSP